MKALASILFEISCTQDFQILFSKGHNSEKGRNSDMKKIRVNYFFMRNVHMKFQNPSIQHSKVNTHTDTQTSRKQYALPTLSKLGEGRNTDMKKNTGQLFYHEECVYEISKP